jgi:hypothetical protein
MKREKLSVRDIRDLLEGETKTFYVPDVKDLRTAQSMTYRVIRFEPELGVTFKTSLDFENLSITITAQKI